MFNFFKQRFTPGDRINMLHVAYELAFYGTKSYSIPHYYSKYLEEREDNIAVWKAWLYHLERISLILGRRETFRNLRVLLYFPFLSSSLTRSISYFSHKSIKDYAIRVMNSKISRSSLDIWTNSDIHTEELLKISFAEALCKYQDKDCLDKTTELFRSINPSYFYGPFGAHPYDHFLFFFFFFSPIMFDTEYKTKTGKHKQN